MSTIETDSPQASGAAFRPVRATTTDAQRWPMLAGFLCAAFLAFVAGAFLMYVNVGPADGLRRAFQGGLALYDRTFDYNDPVQTDFWQPARTDQRGVVVNDPARAQQGFTLYSSGHAQKAFLIDMSGRVVHQWSLPFSRVWDTTSSIARPRPDEFIYMEKAHVFPNGDLLALYTAIGDTPWGYGLVKMDKDSNIIWKYFGRTHHDFDLDRQGNIYVLTHEISEADLHGFDELNKPRIDDFIVKLSPDGKELRKLWLIDALTRSPFGRKLYFVPWNVHSGNGDYLHTNSIQVLRRAVPGIPQSRRGQVLVSMREISTLALVDLESQKIVWAQSGPWVRQHDARFLANGDLMLFDNEGNPVGPGVSRAIEINPATQAPVWSYGTKPSEPLDSVARSSLNRLANGNTIIVESMAGRVLEVTPKGETVWEFVNPVRGGAQQERIPIIFWVERLDPGHDLTPEFRATLDLK
jgi:Arylsulfotransferase (ASST)